MARIDILRGVNLFEGLSDQELETLADRLGRRVFGKGVVLFHKDSPGETMYVIESGKVRIFLLSESGQEVSVNIYGPGEVFGELSVFDGLPRSAGAVALEPTVTYTLHRDDFLRHLEACPQMAIRIIRMLSARVRYTTAYAENLVFLDVYGRVAAKLLELAQRYGVETEGTKVALRLTQTELASWVGATRERVNKVLRAFRDQGLLDIHGKEITILNPRGLRQRILY